MGDRWEINLWTPCPVCDTIGVIDECKRCKWCNGSGYQWEAYRRGQTLRSAIRHWIGARKTNRPVQFIWRPAT